MDPTFLIIGVLVTIAVIALLANKKKKPKPDVFVPTPPVVVPPVITEPIVMPPVAPGTYDPFTPIELTPEQEQALMDLSARDRRIVELFAPHGAKFTAVKDLSRVSGDPAAASFDSAVERGILEAGRTAADKQGYRVAGSLMPSAK